MIPKIELAESSLWGVDEGLNVSAAKLSSQRTVAMIHCQTVRDLLCKPHPSTPRGSTEQSAIYCKARSSDHVVAGDETGVYAWLLQYTYSRSYKTFSSVQTLFDHRPLNDFVGGETLLDRNACRGCCWHAQCMDKAQIYSTVRTGTWPLLGQSIES